jgi:hypothetical protein
MYRKSLSSRRDLCGPSCTVILNPEKRKVRCKVFEGVHREQPGLTPTGLDLTGLLGIAAKVPQAAAKKAASASE